MAVRRFLCHRLAVAGLVVFVAIVALVGLGDRWVATTAAETRLWIGARPPGYSHPHCRAEQTFVCGQEAPLDPALAPPATLTFLVRQQRTETARIVLSRDRIRGITRGAEALDRLDLQALAEQVCEAGEDGSLGRPLPRGALVVGEAPPPGLFGPGQRVLIVAWQTTGETTTYQVSLAGGQVRDIRATGADGEHPIPQVTLRGPDIERVEADGRELRLRHPLGTDELGRDLWLRIVSGGRVSLLVAAVATAVSLLVGVAYGAIAGYHGGRTDAVMMRVVDILYGLPFIFLVLLLMVVFDRNILLLFAALGLVQWLTMARIVRGQILSLREREFVDAARMAGAGPATLILRHLLPHTLGPVVVYATLTVPVVIMEESFLAFIGLPVQFQGTTLDSWGSLVHLGMSALGEAGQKWWLLVFPSLAMALSLFSLNCLGDGLRDCLDPKD